MKSGNASSLAFIFLTLVFTVSGQLLVKRGMISVGASPQGLGALVPYIIKATFSPFVLAGLICAGLAAFSWMAAVSRSDLSFAYPFMGLAIVLTLAMTPICFGERIHLHQWLGVGIVVVGVWIASRPA